MLLCLLLRFRMMMLYVFWYEITPAVSMLSILACTLMIGVSFALYGIRNIKIMKHANGEKRI